MKLNVPEKLNIHVADISKAKSIGYSPENDFKKELIETVNWFKN